MLQGEGCQRSATRIKGRSRDRYKNFFIVYTGAVDCGKTDGF
jgi:hypothetical protein